MTEISNDYVCELQDVRGAFFGSYPDLPGSDFVAPSRAEIDKCAQAAMTNWMQRAEHENWVIPKPGAAEEMSGTIRIRVPKKLHRHILQICNKLDASLSSVVTSVLYSASRWMQSDTNLQNCGELSDEPLEITVSPGRFSRYADENASGVWTQNVPKDLQFKLAWLADQEGVSLNLLCATLLSRALFGSRIDRDHLTTTLRAA